MRVSSEFSRRAAETAYLLKIAVWTIPRCGGAAIAFLLLGMFLLHPAFSAFEEYQISQNTPVVTGAAITQGTVSLDEILQIDGVEKATPVLRKDAELTDGENTIACKVLAVQSGYLEYDFLEGQVFPDRSNMPVLVVNQAVGFACGDTIHLSTEAGERTAQICGVFDDGREEPTVYMSYETAVSLWHKSATELLLTVSGEKDREGAATQLLKLGILLDDAREEDDSAVIQMQQSRLLFLLSLGFLLCAHGLLRERHRWELLAHGEEFLALRSLGIRKIFPLRVFAAAGLCSTLAGLTAAAAGVYSVPALCGCVCCALVAALTGIVAPRTVAKSPSGVSSGIGRA